MTTKSKFPLLAIIVLSLILFIAAFLWKIFHVDNSEEIYIEPIKSITINTNKPIKINKVKQNAVVEQPKETIPVEVTQHKIQKLESKLNLHLMYKTPEDVIKAIEYYESKNDFEKVELFTDFLIENFPDYDF